MKELLHKIFHLLQEWREEQKQQYRQIMIQQATLDASLAGLTTAVQNAANALAAGSTATSTPDTSVSAYQSGVDAQTQALASATPPNAVPSSVHAAAIKK